MAKDPAMKHCFPEEKIYKYIHVYKCVYIFLMYVYIDIDIYLYIYIHSKTSLNDLLYSSMTPLYRSLHLGPKRLPM